MKRIIFLILLSNLISASYGQEAASIINEEFTNKPFGKILSVKMVKEVMPGNIKKEKLPVKNKFTGGFDTLLIFKTNDGELAFYKNPEKVFFYKANIFGKGIILAKGVKIGMSRDQFIRTFEIKSSIRSDLFIIKNTNEFGNHKFHFKNDSLVKIELDAGID